MEGRSGSPHYDVAMALTYEETELAPVAVLTGDVHSDDRGAFRELGKQSEFRAFGLPPFVQENESRSHRGVLRGLHYQLEPHAQGKLVRAVSGAVWDVAVDIRSASPTFGEWFGMTLSGDDHTMLWVPPGFAHGFLALTDDAIVQYRITAEYHAASERSIAYDDARINIDWPVVGDFTISAKDRDAPRFADADVFD